MKHKNQDGWSFIETLIVIAIVLILTATVGFSAIKYVDRARLVTARTQIESFVAALESYYIDCGKYPSQEEGLDALWEIPMNTSISKKWNGPYLYKAVPNDPWGNPYEYNIPGLNGLQYSIRSFGGDGFEGGEGNDADILSWE